MSRTVYFITHPDVIVDPTVPVPEWPLSARGRERMLGLNAQPWLSEIGAIFCSAERKAMDGAAILSELVGVGFETVAALGENDRSSTGYLPGREFQRVADEFFAQPMKSVRGWERAVDAQARIAGAVFGLDERAGRGGAIAVVSHGGVGTLLLCRLKGVPIDRGEEQPATAGGNYFVFDLPSGELIHGWRPIDR